jgi:hypothetical protein
MLKTEEKIMTNLPKDVQRYVDKHSSGYSDSEYYSDYGCEPDYYQHLIDKKAYSDSEKMRRYNDRRSLENLNNYHDEDDEFLPNQ